MKLGAVNSGLNILPSIPVRRKPGKKDAITIMVSKKTSGLDCTPNVLDFLEFLAD